MSGSFQTIEGKSVYIPSSGLAYIPGKDGQLGQSFVVPMGGGSVQLPARDWGGQRIGEKVLIFPKVEDTKKW